jgi:hypothetical protein
MRSPQTRVTFDEWHDAGLDNLLVNRSIAELAEVLSSSASQLADWLQRGMRSTARTRINEYRNLTEAIAVHFPDAVRLRDEGRNKASSFTLRDALTWHSQIPAPIDQAYALLGIADAIIP